MNVFFLQQFKQFINQLIELYNSVYNIGFTCQNKDAVIQLGSESNDNENVLTL